MFIWHPIFEEMCQPDSRQQIVKEAQRQLASKSGKLQGLEQQLSTDVPSPVDVLKVNGSAKEVLKQRSFKGRNIVDQSVDVDLET